MFIAPFVTHCIYIYIYIYMCVCVCMYWCMTTSMYCLYVRFDYTYIDINTLAQGIKSFFISQIWFQAFAGARTYGTDSLTITSHPANHSATETCMYVLCMYVSYFSKQLSIAMANKVKDQYKCIYLSQTQNLIVVFFLGFVGRCSRWRFGCNFN